MGLVPSIFVNPENGDGIYASSKPENVYEKSRLAATWVAVGAFLITFLVRNVLNHNVPLFRETFEEINKGKSSNDRDYEQLPQNDDNEADD